MRDLPAGQELGLGLVQAGRAPAGDDAELRVDVHRDRPKDQIFSAASLLADQQPNDQGERSQQLQRG